jgi:hypothetical protein
MKILMLIMPLALLSPAMAYAAHTPSMAYAAHPHHAKVVSKSCWKYDDKAFANDKRGGKSDEAVISNGDWSGEAINSCVK